MVVVTSGSEKTNQGVRQGCPMSPTIFSIYTNKDTHNWEIQLTSYFRIGPILLNTILFAGKKVTFS
jgi:hypothetical protein